LDAETLQSPEYLKDLNSFKVMYNPLFEHYYPLTILFGPRSRILEDLILLKVPDIRYNVMQNEWLPIFNFYVPYLPVILLALVLYVVFMNEIKRVIRGHYGLVALLVLLIIGGVRVANSYLGIEEKGWNIPSINEEGKWMEQDGTLLFLNSEGWRIAEFSATLSAYSIDRNVDVYLNGEYAGTFNVLSEKPQVSEIFHYAILLQPKHGFNKISLHAEPGCLVPKMLDPSNSDIRCISIHLWNHSFELPVDRYIRSKGWYPQSPTEVGMWMRDNATIVVLPEAYNFTLKASGSSMWKNRTLYVYQDGKYMTNWTFDAVFSSEHYLTTNLSNSSFTTFEFVSDESCTIPAQMPGGWPDFRCLSVRISGFEFVSGPEFTGSETCSGYPIIQGNNT
jgi:hypothetical protein